MRAMRRHSVRVQVLVRAALDADYSAHSAFDRNELRLITAVVNTTEQFNIEFDQFARTFLFESEVTAAVPVEVGTPVSPVFPSEETCDDDENGIQEFEVFDIPDPKAFPDLGSIILIDWVIERPKKGIMKWIETVYQRSRGLDLGSLGHGILPSVFREQSAKWEMISKQYLSKIILLVHRFIMVALEVVCRDAHVLQDITSAIISDLCIKYEGGMDQATFLVDVERQLKPSFDNLIINLRDVAEAVRNKSNAAHAKETIHDTLEAYYKVAYKRFVDNIFSQVVDHKLLSGPESPLRLFSEQWVLGLKTEKLRPWRGSPVARGSEEGDSGLGGCDADSALTACRGRPTTGAFGYEGSPRSHDLIDAQPVRCLVLHRDGGDVSTVRVLRRDGVVGQPKIRSRRSRYRERFVATLPAASRCTMWKAYEDEDFDGTAGAASRKQASATVDLANMIASAVRIPRRLKPIVEIAGFGRQSPYLAAPNRAQRSDSIMADPLSIASGVIGVIVATAQSTKALYETVQSFRDQPRAVRQLQDELKSLDGVLGSLHDAVKEEATFLLSLQLPLRQCGEACGEFRALVVRCTTHSDGARPSVRDWVRLRYMDTDIRGFTEMLAGYKSTISVALADANLRSSKITRAALDDGRPLTVEDRQWFERERQSTEHCLDICAHGLARLDELRLGTDGTEGPASAQHYTLAEITTMFALRKCRDDRGATPL
ncbi:uncharacterized protein VDAG_02421 [Verticillium dahliae VdLs.17]|uniref:Azaphilone pigments biosynthesis cluster protein L N-terminal domain-containing protein n=1 Tax=Verticillium dahliae (strain VdLs.17 / ATCC MYA-4575 / FGSC 10137) TaxID=498257 RepID=G2WXT9_VERDV|nr:uncharacterized protein VDAG_02421 [Verticillium dahliae VdLs.17]EGY20897.1 hypothetical protein VDAG_02421 [Verticillium dahliae VdLs.17]